MLKKILLGIVIIIVIIQFIPVERSNPPVTQDINPPEKISAILRTSCYDCHSNETNWPWYSYIAPVSYLVAGDVKKARKRINFSEWDKYDEKKRGKILEKIVDVVEEGEMPLKSYIYTHPNAELDMARKKSIKGLGEVGKQRGKIFKI